MITIHESIWEQVRPHSWKYEAKRRSINAIIWHITGSGSDNTSLREFNGTKNWFISPNNKFTSHNGSVYGAISNLLVGPPGVCEVVPIDTHMPRFSTYSSDEHAVSVEVAFPTVEAFLDPDTMRHCVQLGRELRALYSIPHRRVWPRRDYANDLVWAGEAGHADTWQNQHHDPGERWWAEYLRLTAEEDDMTPEQVRTIVEDFIGATFPAYIEAYFDRGFTARSGQNGNPPPRAFWQPDLDALEARLKAQHSCGITLPGVATDGG